jgi:hypothetical protein
MIYSVEKRFLFIHNPKVAGTSVRKALQKYDSSGEKYWRPYYVEKYDRIVDRAHIQASEYEVHSLEEISDRFFTFGFVRNPYERFLSAWEEFKLQHNLDDYEDINDWAIANINEIAVRYDWRLIHFCPQHYFFYVGQKCVADFIGKQEFLNQDWLRVQNIIGVNEPLGHFNKKRDSVQSRLTDILSEETISLINKIYAKDFLYFNYPMHDAKPVSSSDPYLDYYENALLPQRKLYQAMNQEIKSLRDELDKNLKELSHLRNRELHLHNDNENYKNKIFECEKCISLIQEEVSKKNEEISAMIDSKSFKITAPLRTIARVIRKINY